MKKNSPYCLNFIPVTGKIKTYGVQSFIGKHTLAGEKAGELLKDRFEKFFIVKVEDMFRTMKLPIPPTRATINSFIYLTEGEANMDIGGESYVIHSGECLIIPAGQVFSFDSQDVNKGFQCSFHNDFIVGKYVNQEVLKSFDFLRIWGNARVSMNQTVSGFVLQLFKRMFLEYKENGLQNIDLIQTYLLAFLTEINTVYRSAPAQRSGNAVNITHQFRELIFEHARSKHHVSEYAALLNITPNHLNKTVKAITGKSPTQWIDEALILEARVLLHQTSLSISQVAAGIGMLDPSYFSRFFKKYTGLTPQAFRKRIEKS
jgi:AraC-like DNA-binding protein